MKKKKKFSPYLVWIPIKLSTKKSILKLKKELDVSSYDEVLSYLVKTEKELKRI